MYENRGKGKAMHNFVLLHISKRLDISKLVDALMHREQKSE